jgi:thiamine biosynthesis lipoprotein
MMDSIRSATWRALGTTVVVAVSEPEELDRACDTVRGVLCEIDRACSRFREDSEISRLNAAGGRPVRVSRLFLRATRCALRSAQLTGGDLDPTIGSSIRVAGYDRDFAAIRAGAPVRFRRAAGWRCVQLDEANAVVRVPAGVELDFGATAKALAADIAAHGVGEQIDGGVLVSIGGDLATAGTAPTGGWSVRVTDDHAGAADAPGQTIALRSGGLATSSTTVRRWKRGSSELHHILDPATGAPVSEYWRTVSVAAACCVDANIASTTAIIRGASALDWLADAGLPARLVGVDGAVTVLAGWPQEELTAA